MLGVGPDASISARSCKEAGQRSQLQEAGEGHVAKDKVWLQLLPSHLLQDRSTKLRSSQVQSAAEGSIGHFI